MNGYDLQNGKQVVEMHPQDLLVSDSCADYMVKVAQFIDDELVRFYGLPAFYNLKTKDDLVGHLVIGLAPHTSAGVLARIVGFTRANVGYAHPFFHAAKRRNCFYGDTEIEVYEGKTWSHLPIRKFVLENFDVSKPGLDRLGTYYSDPVRPYFTSDRRYNRHDAPSQDYHGFYPPGTCAHDPFYHHTEPRANCYSGSCDGCLGYRVFTENQGS